MVERTKDHNKLIKLYVSSQLGIEEKQTAIDNSRFKVKVL